MLGEEKLKPLKSFLMKNKQKILLRYFSSLIVLALGVFSVNARMIEVPRDYRTIEQAMRSANFGDTVFVANGTYYENIILPDGVSIKGENMVKTILDGERKGPVVVGANNSYIGNLTITNGTTGILCKNSTPSIERNLILDNKGTGIHCLLALPNIRNNIIMRNKWCGIFCESAKSLNTAIEHNVVLENYYSGIFCANNTQVVIRNNILFDNEEYGVYCDKAATHSRIVYNDIYKNNFPFNRYTIVDKSNISRAPNFADAGYPNFNLYVRSISPCKNRGENGVDIGLLSEDVVKSISMDQDNDGILDAADRCPTVPEDKDGFEDEDGCPDYDNDKDGIFDADDKCPNEPEDRDGFEDEDGCPDTDNDKDGLPDERDRCPNVAETFNGYKDEDGCPDEKPKMIQAKLILKGVNFITASAELTEESYSILDEVYNSLEAFPEVRVEISGHTDAVGMASYNKMLSQDRANSVRNYLLSRGILPTRITAVGYGKERPIASNSSNEGRAQNRRVEIIPIR
jgi:outer membrane protein OmpA-like peptidoglycan-associated protein